MRKIIIVCSVFCAIQFMYAQQVQKMDQIQFNNNVWTTGKILYLKNGKVVAKVLGTALQPNFETDVTDSTYNGAVGVNFWVRTKGGKALSGFGAFGDGEFGASGRRQGDSTQAFNRFFAAWNDSILAFNNGTEYNRLDVRGQTFHKNVYLYDPTTDLASPVLRFMQPNSVAGGTTDSVTISMADSPLGVKAIKVSNPLQFTNTPSNALTGLAELITMNGDTLIMKGVSGIARWVPFGANNNQVPSWNGSSYIPADQSGGGGGSTGNGIKARLSDLSLTIYPDTMLTFNVHNLKLANGATKEGLVNTIQDIATTDAPTFANLQLGNSGILTIKSSTGTSAFIDYPTGANSPFFHFPGLNGTFTVATIDGGQNFTNATWNAGAVTSNGALGTIGVGSNLTIAGTGASSIAGNLGLGITPATIFHTSSSSQTEWRADNYGSSAPAINLRRAENTFASPQLTQNGDVLGQLHFSGYDGVSFASNPGARILALTTENYSASAHGTALKFYTTPNGATVSSERLRINQSGTIDVPSGSFYSSIIPGSLSANRSDTIPNGTGTFVVSAASPLSINANGQISITGGFIQSLNGLTATTQTLSLNFSGTTPAWVSSVTDHQLRLQDAGSGMLHGLVTNGSQTIVGKKTMNDVFKAQAEAIGFLKTSATVVNLTEQATYIECDPSVNGNMTLNLPNITSEPNAMYVPWRYTAGIGSNTVTLVPFGSEKIEGQSSIVLSLDNDFLIVANDGTSSAGWKVFGGRVGGTSYFNTVNGGWVGDFVTVTALTDSVYKSVPGMIAGGHISANWSVSQTRSITPQGVPNAVMLNGGYFVKTYSPQNIDVLLNVIYQRNW